MTKGNHGKPHVRRQYTLTDTRKLRRMHQERAEEQALREVHDFPKANQDPCDELVELTEELGLYD